MESHRKKIKKDADGPKNGGDLAETLVEATEDRHERKAVGETVREREPEAAQKHGGQEMSGEELEESG